MKLFVAMVALLAASASNMMASGIVLCYDTVGGGAEVARATPCATQANFSVMPHTDFVDWGLPTTQVAGQPYGLGTSTDPVFNYSPNANANASWNARSTQLVTAGVNTANGFTGVDNLQRLDQGNFVDAFTKHIFTGHFNDGDHLVGLSQAQGPMRIDFDLPITSIGFYISTKTNTDFIATIKAYDHVNPLSSDIPILTYRINTNGTGGGGDCAGENDFPSTACNDAPFVGLDGYSALLGAPQTFRSIVITTNDTSGFFIDSLYLGDQSLGGGDPGSGTPEPASAFLIGGGMVVVALVSRKYNTRP